MLRKRNDTIVDMTMETDFNESNNIEESYVKAIQDSDIFCEDLANYEHEKLTNCKVV